MKKILLVITLLFLTSLPLFSRPTVVITDFQSSEFHSRYRQDVTAYFSHYFVKSQRVSVVERSRLQDVLSELRLSASDLFSRENAVRVGKLLSARYVLTGTLSEKTAGILVIHARIIDIEQGIIKNSSVREFNPYALKNACREISSELLRTRIEEEAAAETVIENPVPSPYSQFNTFKYNLNALIGSVTDEYFFVLMGFEWRIFTFLSLNPGAGYLDRNGKTIPLSFKAIFYPLNKGELVSAYLVAGIRPYLYAGIYYAIPVSKPARAYFALPLMIGSEFHITQGFVINLEFGLSFSFYPERNAYYQGGLGMKFYF